MAQRTGLEPATPGVTGRYQRQRRQEHPLGRHHVFRQARLERRLQHFTQGAALLVLQRTDILRHHVAHQLLAVRAIAGQHHRFAHALLLQQARNCSAPFLSSMRISLKLAGVPPLLERLLVPLWVAFAGSS